MKVACCDVFFFFAKVSNGCECCCECWRAVKCGVNTVAKIGVQHGVIFSVRNGVKNGLSMDCQMA